MGFFFASFLLSLEKSLSLSVSWMKSLRRYAMLLAFLQPFSRQVHAETLSSLYHEVEACRCHESWMMMDSSCVFLSDEKAWFPFCLSPFDEVYQSQMILTHCDSLTSSAFAASPLFLVYLMTMRTKNELSFFAFALLLYHSAWAVCSLQLCSRLHQRLSELRVQWRLLSFVSLLAQQFAGPSRAISAALLSASRAWPLCEPASAPCAFCPSRRVALHVCAPEVPCRNTLPLQDRL